MKEIIKKYTNGEVTIIWQPAKCQHSGICFGGLLKVFNPSKRPWIDMNNATSEEMILQVSKCPSGALSIQRSVDDNT